MQLREFWQCVDTIMGIGHGRTVVDSHILTALAGRTAHQALSAGVDPGVVWRTLCDEFDLPDNVRWGLPDPPESR